MVTYASPTALKWILLTINSINFVIGTYIMTIGAIQLIGVEAPPDASNESDTTNSKSDSSEEDNSVNMYNDRFPSAGSAGTIALFGVLIMFVSCVGCTAVNRAEARLLDMYGYFSLIGCFIKFLFICATINMHGSNDNYDPISLRPVLLSIGVSVIELVLGMCGCQLAKILKRGDAAEPKIEPLPEKV